MPGSSTQVNAWPWHAKQYGFGGSTNVPHRSHFDATRRPWIDVDAAPPDALAAAIARCPTGALHFRRLDGAAQEAPQVPARIVASADGPLHVRGSVRLETSAGELVREDTRVAICRCGGTENPPFCDGSHRRVGFRSSDAG